ncbi:chemotaxis protein CheA [Marinomonas spartinae]|uniref:chemotaxis protein CheA n=1 Tax=Marinomonas spartinae TaxID=1792290 RepID=UPI0018F230B2|nr:chemotaxis protein CheA [Marinomonas spartinae]MBJ7554396.1 chemotaxis protein CheA [Marinomonas spartinae]
MDDMSQFREMFFEEAQEHLETMETFLLDYDPEGEPDIEALNSVFRAAHSIKGGSDIFGFKAMTGLTHVMENLLDSARNQELFLTNDLITVLLETIDLLKIILNNYHEEIEIDWDEVESGKTRLKSVLQEAHDVQKEAVQKSPVQEEASELTASDAEDEGFGFFEQEIVDANDTELEDEGFGFFEQEVAGSNDSALDDEGFGFFEQETEEINGSSGLEDEGFGFFETASLEEETAEESQGYGFFQERLETDMASSSPSDQQSKEEIHPSQGNQMPSAVSTTKLTSAKEDKTPVVKGKAAAESKSSESASIRVETVKIDKLVNLVGELVITQSMLNLIGSEAQESIAEKMQTALTELERNTREIQEAVMSVRMLPISFVFNRFPRLVRDLSNKLTKNIELVIEGGSTEIDKNLVEKISDPLTHLIRNSVDHGIEPPAERIAKGKPEKGVVKLIASQRGGEIVITVSDDGAGLNKERILNKALEKGISLPDPLTDAAIWLLIFAPGFSTAAEVTDVSGRGVGMDVVRRNIEALGGRVSIESNQGVGTTFEIRLPLTLAILDGMCVENASQVFVIPLVNIVESIQPLESQIKVMQNRQLLWVRDEYWPLINLEEALYGGQHPVNISESIVVLVETAKRRYGLIVDGLLGQQQVVIKSLERHYRRVKGVAGATIMGDGSVALILDIESLVSSQSLELEEEIDHVILT